MSNIPLGIRINNPGNIRKSADKWQGLSEQQTDSAFLQFKSPEWGIRAIARILIRYNDDYSLNTIKKIITRWAPPEDKNDTKEYINIVSSRTGFSPNQKLDMQKYEDICPIIKAIIHVETGKDPYNASLIDKGLALAGIEPPKKPLAKSKTVAGAVVTAVGTVGTKALELSGPIQQTNEQLSAFSDIDFIRYICLGLTIFGISLTLYAYLTDRKKRLT